MVGDALAALMEFAGYRVVREYYINDAGGQVDVLARSAHLRYREALGETIEIAEGLYPGDYLIPVGQRLAERFGDQYVAQPEAEWLALFRKAAVAEMMEMIKQSQAKKDLPNPTNPGGDKKKKKKCPHCEMEVYHSETCFKLEANVAKCPAGWKSKKST